MLPDFAQEAQHQRRPGEAKVALGVKFPFETIAMGKKVLYGPNFKDGYDAVLGCNDVMSFVKDIPDESVMLIVTSPPYNIGKPYEERLEFKEYLKWQKDVIEECAMKLDRKGSICWEAGNYIKKGEVFPLDTFFYRILKELGLKLRNRIVWSYGHGLQARRRFSGRYETILWFTKSDDYAFDLDAVREPQKYPGKRSYKGPNKGKPSAHPLGKNPSDVWNIPNVKSNHPEKTIHPCQFPIELAERFVLALTNENDVVLDPFMGVGSSLVAAILHNRKTIGVDKEREYTDVAYKRLISTLNGTLKRRPFGQPIYVPNGTEKVAKIPEEWLNQSLHQPYSTIEHL